MDRYQKVEKPRAEEAIKENEIRVTAQGLIRNYISYATTLLQDQRTNEVVLKAMGQAISKTVAIAEIIKKRIPGLHQDTSISSTTITDAYEPLEEGLQPLEMTRQVSLITITLSTAELNKSSPGYQAPSHSDQSGAENQQLQQARQAYVLSDLNQDSYGIRGRGRGRGRSRGLGRGRGRGGYGNYYQDDGGYYNQGRGGELADDGGYYNPGRGGGFADNGGYFNQGGRGRCWGYRGMGYGRGRGRGGGWGGGRGYSRGRGRMGGRGGRGVGNQYRYKEEGNCGESIATSKEI
ncbi:protein FAM98B [Capsicum galapagoense]